ncbi:hypothetical protein BDZ89DRAFT_1110210 [Hymenopellis radicata]|nr:hypothetical protein BDZ89DRAFT_1110210 [Hymenopellis radicata]
MAQPTPTDTPRRPQSASQQAGGPMLGLAQQRAALRKTIPAHTVQTASPLAFLKRHCSLPELSSCEYEGLLAYVITELKERELLKDSEWPATKIDSRTEGAIFKQLEPIIATIGDICLLWDDKDQKLNDRTTTFECDGSNTTNSEVPGSSFMVDAQFILLDRCTPPSNVAESENDKADTVDISPAEFKKDVKDRADNEIKIASAANHTLFNDYSRRFVLGFTIEGVEMRFWYFSRSHIAVSPAFDYHQEPELFVRFVIFMTFADRIDLGYDPTVIRIRDADNNIRYQFEVNGKFYLTESFIAESGANDIVTRATRVWSVREYDPVTGMFIGLDSVVLKDVWLFSDSEGEKKIFDDIFSALKNLDDQLAAGKDHRELGMDDVAVTFTRGNVQYCDAAPAPETGYTPFTYAPEKKSRAAVLGKVPGSLRAEVGKNEAPPVVEESKESPPTPIHDHPERTHRRIVFRDRCSTLYSLVDYADYALAMVQVIQALNFLRLAGYVHRDISPGNCLYIRDSSEVIQIKISDLEYARPYSRESSHTVPITGTPGFMAVESQCLRHLFIPESIAPPPEQFIYRGGKSTFCGPAITETEEVPDWFRFNFLHDIESALWLFCWFLFNRLPSSLLGNVSRAQCESIAKVARKLFGTSLDPPAMRRSFIGGFEASCTYPEVHKLLKSYYQQDTQHGLTILNGLIAFKSIIRFYKEVESATPIRTAQSFMWAPKEFRPAYYRELQGIFYRMSGPLNGSNLSAVPIHLFDPLKRAADTLAADDEDDGEEVRPNKRARTEPRRYERAVTPPSPTRRREKAISVTPRFGY